MTNLLNVFTQTNLFENPLPIPERIDATSGGNFKVEMRETQQYLGLSDANGNRLQTTVWGYGLEGEEATYPGPTFVAQEGKKVKIKWINKLPDTGYFNPDGSYFLPIDLTLHRAQPKKLIEDGYVPTVTHLHGGHTKAKYDGYPEDWFLQKKSANYTYENDQRNATLWYHDHALGFTRLNVYAGLAGFYLLRDETENDLIDSGILPGGSSEIEMAIQDRAFTEDGQLFLPSNSEEQEALYGEVLFPNTDIFQYEDNEGNIAYTSDPNNDPHIPDGATLTQVPSTMPEFFGNVIMVNGMAWPSLEVDNTQYRFRMLNGADSRFYILGLQDTDLSNGIQLPTVYQIGTDGGLLEAASEITFFDGDIAGDGIVESFFVIAPGERKDLVFDFTGLEGENINLLNFGPALEPFGGFGDFETAFDIVEEINKGDLNPEEEAKAGFAQVGQIMQFQVQDNPDAPTFGIEEGTTLAPDDQPEDVLVPDAEVALTRKLGLFEGTDEFGRVKPLVGLAEDVYDAKGNLVDEFGPQKWVEPTTEKVLLNTTEIWEFYNFTEDAHPVHLHLTQYEVLGWETFDFTDENEDGIADDLNGDKKITIGKQGTNNDILLNPGIITPEERYEDGWQDTTWVGPGEVLRVKALFDLPGEYVWHCHILSHEDHEMMRPFEVVKKPKDVIAAAEYFPIG